MNGEGRSVSLEGLVVGSRYLVARFLQSGFFGKTWLARDRQCDRDVCLKVFKTSVDGWRARASIHHGRN